MKKPVPSSWWKPESWLQSASPVKTLGGVHIYRDVDFILCRLWARSFLHHQVRNIVGTLKLVGEGKAEIGWVTEALLATDRGAAGPTAPADGLILERVNYAPTD